MDRKEGKEVQEKNKPATGEKAIKLTVSFCFCFSARGQPGGGRGLRAEVRVRASASAVRVLFPVACSGRWGGKGGR